MPIFEISKNKLVTVEKKNFPHEKDLQLLIEDNLQEVFNCRFVASEFSTGAHHAGRIDSLALSEENTPVIIEYKKVKSSELINQSLFYLHWILHAVQVMGTNIELWKYLLFSNNTLYLEKVFHDTYSKNKIEHTSAKSPVMVAAGKKAAQTRATSTYTFEKHLEEKSKQIQQLILIIRDFVTGLDTSIEEVPKKFYIAYKSSKNIVCIQAGTKQIKLWVRLKPNDVKDPPKFFRDVSNIGHQGTGDVEFSITSPEEFEEIKKYIEYSYNKVGG